jgi:hypothetical protein
MRVLYAFVSQEHYTNWSSANVAITETIPSIDGFLREFGTPLITFDSTDNGEFVRVVDGGYVRINYNYYNDLAVWNSSSVSEQTPVKEATEAVEAIPITSSIGSIYTTISTKLTSFLNTVFKPKAQQV